MKNNIELTCVADGKKMDFIPAVDLYTILGNVVDNAIESVLLVSDEGSDVDTDYYKSDYGTDIYDGDKLQQHRQLQNRKKVLLF